MRGLLESGGGGMSHTPDIEQEESYKCGSCSERVVDYCSYLNKYLYIIDNEEYYRCVECIVGNYKMNEDGCFIEDELT